MKPIVVINKVDRPSSRVEEVESEIFDLFCNLDANDDQLEYPTIYAAARDGCNPELPERFMNHLPDINQGGRRQG